MNRLMDITGSVLGRTVGLRLGRHICEPLYAHLSRDASKEQFAYALGSQARTADGTIVIIQKLLLPDADDLESQSRGHVVPSKEYQATVYSMAKEAGLTIVDIHTHPFQKKPLFSGVDEAESARNAQDVCERFPYPITHVMAVFGEGIEFHDAVIFDRSLQGYRTIDYIEVVGRGMEVRPTGEPNGSGGADPRFDRQVMVPGWNQAALSRLRVAIVGLGGNGAHVLQRLVSMGVGRDGWLAGIDLDIIEISNLPRIAYATAEDVGSPKATVAARYAGQRDPRIPFYPYPCSVTADAAVERIKAANFLIGAGDGDGVRQFCNELAVRYLIPYVDLGCEVQVDEDKVEAGGQVRVVLPGENACLVCCGGFDPSEAAIELMDDAAAAAHAARGYVRGSREQATPSIANLNAITAELGVNAVLQLACGEPFRAWDYLHFNHLSGETIPALTRVRSDCPLCGPDGLLAAGDEIESKQAQRPNWGKWTPENDKNNAATV